MTALAAAMRNRPELHQAEGNIRNQDVAVEYTKEKLRPSLSLFGVLASQARGGSILKTGSTTSLIDVWSDVGNLNFPEYAFGFSMSFPIGNRAAQADHQTALLNR